MGRWRRGIDAPRAGGRGLPAAADAGDGCHAARHGVPVVDFRIRSPVTTRDENYWDRLHYRVPIATRIIDGLARALAAGKDDPGGDWRMLNAPAPADRRS